MRLLKIVVIALLTALMLSCFGSNKYQLAARKTAT